MGSDVKDGAVHLIVVWIDMLPGDNPSAAAASAAIFAPLEDVSQFHDPGRLVGKEVARSLEADGQVAWDMYLFYPAGVRWGEAPPQPREWVHQLGDAPWAGPSHIRWGALLEPALSEAMQRVLEQHEDN